MTSTETSNGYSGAAAEHARQPGGVPSGGQFSTATRREPDVTLAHLSDAEYNADGTFEYPPIPRSVEQLVAFWSRVRVPDAVMARVRSAYRENWSEWADARMVLWVADNPEPDGRRLLTSEKKVAEWDARYEAQVALLRAERSDSLPAVLARPLIRAAQMDRFGQWLDDQAQYDQVLATEIDLGQDVPFTARETLEEWHLDELPEAAFEDAGNYAGINAARTQVKLTELVELLSRDQE